MQRARTLDRLLSRQGLCSRSEARRWITAGRVQVNGRVVRQPLAWLDPEADEVALDGRPVRAAVKLYLALHKPKGYLTTFGDPRGLRTVYELLGGVEAWVFPVGRLDRDTSGLLLLTNDTELGERVTNPAFGLVKALPRHDQGARRGGGARAAAARAGPGRWADVAGARDARRSPRLDQRGRARDPRGPQPAGAAHVPGRGAAGEGAAPRRDRAARARRSRQRALARARGRRPSALARRARLRTGPLRQDLHAEAAAAAPALIQGTAPRPAF